MITGHVFIATSLDGFIARRDGALDWLPMEPEPGEDWGYDAFIAGMDGIVMGRGTYEAVSQMEGWSYPIPVVVVSRTLSQATPPAGERVEFVDAAPQQVMQMLSDRGWRHVYIDGGRLIQSYLRAGLIADMIVTRVPVLLGDGRPLFGPLEKDIRLRHEETRSFASGLVQSRYVVLPEGG